MDAVDRPEIETGRENLCQDNDFIARTKGETGLRHLARLLLILALSAPTAAGRAVPARAADTPPAATHPLQRPTAGIRGEVERPGAYELREGGTLSSLILRAGGYTDSAWLPGAILTRTAEKSRQAEELAGIVGRLEAAVREAGPGDAEPGPMRRFLDALRNLSPSGRVPVRLSHPRLMINSPDDLALEEGDELFLPPAPRTVRVTGAVRNPGDYPAPPGARLAEIAASAGGFLPEADADGTILLKADGTARWTAEPWIVWNDDAGRWELSAFRKDRPRIEAGDTIFVPKRIGPIRWPGGIDDWRRTTMRILLLTGAGAAR